MNTSAGCLDVVIVLRIPGLLCLDDASGLSTVAFSFLAIMLRCKWQISLHIYKRGTTERRNIPNQEVAFSVADL